MKKNGLLLIMLLSGMTAFSQTYFVAFFKDKANSTYSFSKPQDYLSEKAINRRTKQNIAIDSTDLPVNSSYVQAVSQTGAIIINRSKWFNWVSFQADSQTYEQVKKLPMVLDVVQVKGTQIAHKAMLPVKEQNVAQRTSDKDSIYGQAFTQINMLNGVKLHESHYRGKGITIAVLDNGFRNADKMPVFDSLRHLGRIKGTYDFVSPGNNVYRQDAGTHGSYVFSCMGANIPGTMIGTAPDADFWLLCSEDGTSENIIEEYNWISAAEFADSVGADIITSSLGYTTFDQSYQNHSYQDMDGKTTPSTRGANMAFDKGMVVVVSAGNEGAASWHYISAPSDGIKVLSIGAVDSNKFHADFSGHGPSYTGAVKPNICAQGQDNFLAKYDSTFIRASGTSFAAPVTAGMIACLWQALPDFSNIQLKNLIEKNADRYANPDVDYGYGIPDYEAALLSVQGQNKNELKEAKIYPNPFVEDLFMDFESSVKDEMNVKIYSMLGTEIYTVSHIAVLPGRNHFTINTDRNMKSGIYFININAGSKSLNRMLFKS